MTTFKHGVNDKPFFHNPPTYEALTNYHQMPLIFPS